MQIRKSSLQALQFWMMGSRTDFLAPPSPGPVRVYVSLGYLTVDLVLLVLVNLPRLF